MKCTIPEILWHSRDPVLSVDVQKFPKFLDFNFWRLATGGSDSHVVIWHLNVNTENVASVNYVTDLDRHQKAVNVVRFSSSGEILASGDDESVIILWKMREEIEIHNNSEETENKEQWTSIRVLRGHIEDVLDISWSPDSSTLISGSVDNSIILWDIKKGKKVSILSDYKGFVQGISYDPLNKYAVSLCADRNIRLIDLQHPSKMKTVQRTNKAKVPVPVGHSSDGQIIRLFHDDTFKSYFRRLTFTPDGLLVIAPSGIIESMNSEGNNCNCTIVFSRHNLKEPVAILPTYDESTIAVVCCPTYFTLQKNGSKPILDLPYRIIFAVATQHSVIIYDTQQFSPIAIISNIHYTRLTDITWSSDSKILIISSSDGYCSIVCFEEGELGETYDFVAKELKSPSNKHNEIVGTNLNSCSINAEAVNEDSFRSDSERNSVNINKLQDSINEDTENFELVLEDTVSIFTTANKTTPPKIEEPNIKNTKTPRRVQLITLSSPRSSNL